MHGVLLTIIGLIVVFVGWAGVAANCAKDDAVKAASNASTIGIRNEEYRTYMKQDMIEVKSSIRALSDKQDRMNESLQRLIQKTDTK
jgi:parvulin-like peptidyl-prolyl isomerase